MSEPNKRASPKISQILLGESIPMLVQAGVFVLTGLGGSIYKCMEAFTEWSSPQGQPATPIMLAILLLVFSGFCMHVLYRGWSRYGRPNPIHGVSGMLFAAMGTGTWLTLTGMLTIYSDLDEAVVLAGIVCATWLMTANLKTLYRIIARTRG